MTAYRVDTIPPMWNRVKAIRFAKELVPRQSSPVQCLHRCPNWTSAGKSGINVAIESQDDPKDLMSSIQGLSSNRSERESRSVDGAWIRPVDGLARLHDR